MPNALELALKSRAADQRNCQLRATPNPHTMVPLRSPDSFSCHCPNDMLNPRTEFAFPRTKAIVIWFC